MVRRNSLLLLLLACCLAAGSCSRQLRGDSDLVAQHVEDRQLSEEAHEHQRILAELEQVHQLRERMLQVGKTVVYTCCAVGCQYNQRCMHHACIVVQLRLLTMLLHPGIEIEHAYIADWLMAD